MSVSTPCICDAGPRAKTASEAPTAPAGAEPDAATAPAERRVVYPCLKVFVAPMFAGKSSRLLFELNRARDVHGGAVALFVHALDRRYELASPLGRDAPPGGFSASTHSNLVRAGAGSIWTARVASLSAQPLPAGCVAVGVDEANFFDGDDLVGAVQRWLAPRPGAPRLVVVCGLDGTKHQRPFERCGIARLLPLADEFTKLRSAACLRCARAGGRETPAAFTIQTSPRARAGIADGEDAEIEIGGAEAAYEAVCREHLHAFREHARSVKSAPRPEAKRNRSHARSGSARPQPARELPGAAPAAVHALSHRKDHRK